MRTSKILILAAVGLLVFGSAGFFGYTLFIKPYVATKGFFHHQKDIIVKAPIDPSLEPFKAALALQTDGKLEEAQAAWLRWLETYPNSSKRTEAMKHLGKINMDFICSPSSTANKISYTVVKGDSLSRIARKEDSNAELISRINALPNINLQIGDVLLIPQLKPSIEIDRNSGVLILRDHDQFFKSYTLLSSPNIGSSKNPVETVVVDRIATAGKNRVAFGSKKYPESEQVILLRSCPNIVTVPDQVPVKPTIAQSAPGTTNAVTAVSTNATAASTDATEMPSGFVLSAKDMREVYPFITRQTPVSVH